MSRSAIYGIHKGIIQRCHNPVNPAYINYGGRGIKVCKRWRKFENFYEDMGDPPFKGATLERIDNDGDYKPGNVRWATRAEQGLNHRRNVVIGFRGRTMLLKDWAAFLGITQQAVQRRIRVWGKARALTTMGPTAHTLGGRRGKA
jgi:hypothetical protein